MRISDWSSDVCSSDLELARIDTRERQRADERIGHDLERQRRERLIVVGLARLFRSVGRHALDRRNVERARQIIDNGVEQRLDALVLDGRTAQHGHEGEVERALADQALQRRDVRSEETTPELQSLMRLSNADSCINKKNT